MISPVCQCLSLCFRPSATAFHSSGEHTEPSQADRFREQSETIFERLQDPKRFTGTQRGRGRRGQGDDEDTGALYKPYSQVAATTMWRTPSKVLAKPQAGAAAEAGQGSGRRGGGGSGGNPRKQSSKQSRKAAGRQADQLYMRLTDSAQYTGTHRHRFDVAGRGRGLDGRDRASKGVGQEGLHALQPPPLSGEAVHEISQLTRGGIAANGTGTAAAPVLGRRKPARRTKKLLQVTHCPFLPFHCVLTAFHCGSAVTRRRLCSTSWPSRRSARLVQALASQDTSGRGAVLGVRPPLGGHVLQRASVDCG